MIACSIRVYDTRAQSEVKYTYEVSLKPNISKLSVSIRMNMADGAKVNAMSIITEMLTIHKALQ